MCEGLGEKPQAVLGRFAWLGGAVPLVEGEFLKPCVPKSISRLLFVSKLSTPQGLDSIGLATSSFVYLRQGHCVSLFFSCALCRAFTLQLRFRKPPSFG